MERYDDKSCSSLEKVYYKPIEAALRWCNLIEHEVLILQTVGNNLFPAVGDFPQWPCLRANAEKIYDAVINGSLIHGRDGRTVSAGDHVAKERLTIRHTDLKKWMAENYPDQKPKFLFDDIERATHTAINADSFRALQADRDALKARIEKATEEYRKLRQELDTITGERDSLRQIVDSLSKQTQTASAVDPRSETTYLNIIGAMLDIVLGKSPAGQKHSIYDNQGAVISALLAYHEGKQGIASRTLEQKFADAKRSLNAS